MFVLLRPLKTPNTVLKFQVFDIDETIPVNNILLYAWVSSVLETNKRKILPILRIHK